MKKDAINTFTDGLVMDLNPLNTPNTVMTDCLNGTLLTYNGNELSLQNDMGNYLLKNCQLPEFYVPIGVKEYAGILYLVLYNPFSKTVEIGSYPSTRQVIDLESSEAGSTVYLFEGESGRYSDIVSNMKECIFSRGGETYIINPGDNITANKYYMEDDYQKVEYFIRDEYNFDHNVTGDMNEIFKKGSGRASWLVSGKLIAKPRFAELNSMSVVPEIDFNDLSNSVVSFSVTSYDKLFNNSDVKLYVEYQTEIDSDEGLTSKIQLNPNQFDNKVIFEYNNARLQIDTLKDALRIKSTPILEYDDKRIEYDTLTTTQVIYRNLDHDYKIGDSVFQYRINTGDTPSFELWFNMDYADEPSAAKIDEGSYSVACSLFLPDKTPVENCANIECTYDNDRSEEYDIWKMNATSFVPFDKETYSGHKDYFYKENVYIAQIILFKNGVTVYTREFTIIASELLSWDYFGEKYQKYYDIPYTQWLYRYSPMLPKISSSELAGRTSAVSPFMGAGYHTITVYPMNESVPMYVDRSLSAGLGPDLYFYLNILGTYNSKLECENWLCGPMWIDSLKNATFYFNGSSRPGLIDEYSGKVNLSDIISYTHSTIIYFKYALQSVNENNKPIYRYEERVLTKIAKGRITFYGFGNNPVDTWGMTCAINMDDGSIYQSCIYVSRTEPPYGEPKAIAHRYLYRLLNSILKDEYSIIALKMIFLSPNRLYMHTVLNPDGTKILDADGKYLVGFRINGTEEYIVNILTEDEYNTFETNFNKHPFYHYKNTGHQGEWVEIKKKWSLDKDDEISIENRLSVTCKLGDFNPIPNIESDNINLPSYKVTGSSRGTNLTYDNSNVNLSEQELKLINEKEEWVKKQNTDGETARNNYKKTDWMPEKYENIPGSWPEWNILKGYYDADSENPKLMEDYYSNTGYLRIRTTCAAMLIENWAQIELAKIDRTIVK